MSRNRQLVLLGTALFSLPIACHFEPNVPELSYSLNAGYIGQNNPDLDADPVSQARLAGALEFLVGTPADPGYLVTEDWLDDEFDPNYWGLDSLSEEEWEALVASNSDYWSEQLAAIEAGDFEGLPYTRYADDLWAQWEGLLADKPDDPDADYTDETTWREEAAALFESYYPSLAESARFYRAQCFHCHGTEGGGDGSTSPFLQPTPRDYRLGIFKFTAVGRNRPRHQDLFRILREGVYTTAMPSFRRFSDAQLHGVIDYVRLLAVRGETEVLMVTDYDPDVGGFDLETLQGNYQAVVERWRDSGEPIVYEGDVPEATPERIAHGRWLFTSESGANCMKCHGEGGRGDGPSVSEPENSIDDWGNAIAPRDLTRGVFRFGRRPIDLYRRIHSGIYGTPMPEHFGQEITLPDGTKRPLDEDDIWALVHFVRSLSDHPMQETAQAAPDHDPEGGAGH